MKGTALLEKAPLCLKGNIPPKISFATDWPQFWFIWYLVSPRRPQTWSGLKAWRGSGDAFPVLTPTSVHDRDSQNTPSRPPPPNPTLQHQIIVQEQLNFWKAAGLEQVYGSTIFLPKRCKMVPEWPMATNLAFSHTAWLFTTYIHIVYGWVC